MQHISETDDILTDAKHSSLLEHNHLTDSDSAWFNVSTNTV